jgi:hypothetical protein
MYMPFFFVKFGIPKWPVLVFLPLFFAGLIYCFTGDNAFQQFFKIFIGFFSSCLFYHYVVQSYDFDVKELYRLYMKSAFIITLIGMTQLISYFIGFRPGYSYTWIFNKWNISMGGLGIRMSSVLSEPAYYAASIAPAFFTAVYNLFQRKPIFITKTQSVLIALIYPLSYSSLGILAIFITIILLLINLGTIRYSLIFLPLLVVITSYSYKEVPEFRDRWDGTIEVFTTNNIYDYDIHGSSFVLYNNSHVAWENFKRNPIFGTGLGSHPSAFDKYSYTNQLGSVQIDFNKMDANSMFLRLMSETGLYGLAIMLMLLFKSWIARSNAIDDETWVMSNGIAIIILLYLLRQGHYFLNGFPLFLWLYYYLSVQNRTAMAQKREYEKMEDFRQFRPSISANPVAPGSA